MNISTTQEYLSYAKNAFANNNFETAIKWCRNVLKSDKQNITALTIAGQSCIVLNQPAEAEYYLKTAVELDPNNGEFFFHLANSQFGQERYADSFSNYARAEQLKCDDDVKKKLYYVMGIINVMQGDRVAALINFDKSCSVPGENTDLPDILLKRIQIYTEQGDFTQAENYANELRLLVPQEFNGSQLLFQILLQQQKIKKAKEVLQEIEDIFKNSPNAYIEIVFDRAMICVVESEGENDITKKTELIKEALVHLKELIRMPTVSEDIKCEAYVTSAELFIHLNDISPNERMLDSAENYASLVLSEERVNNDALSEMVDKARFILLSVYLYQHKFKLALSPSRKLKENENMFYRYHGYYNEVYSMKMSGSIDAAEAYEKVIAYFAHCMAADGGDILATVYRAKAYTDVGRFDKADELCAILPNEAQGELMKYINSERSKGGGGY